jgi:hypothetical protein
MIGEAYRRFLWHSADIKRNTTAQSDTGASTFNYVTVLTGIPCNVQSGGGRMVQDEWGQATRKKINVLFAREMSGQLQHNDLRVVSGNTFRIVNSHESWYYGEHHVEVSCEVYVPAGDKDSAA